MNNQKMKAGDTGQAAALPDVIENKAIRELLRGLDAISQESLGQISAISQMALMAMESQKFYQYPGVIDKVFKAILEISERAQNEINDNAELLGCNYVDEAERLRASARCRAIKPTEGKE